MNTSINLNPDSVEASPMRPRTTTRMVTEIALERAYIGDLSLCDLQDVAELPQVLVVSTPRDGRYRTPNGGAHDGYIELKLGAHTYLVEYQALLGAMISARELAAD
ncbi:MAG: hypothetical protein ICCCNLDF_03696 [Planctomycetes bacterium]|nr:hypothetical protein [Planctomycetota bacterium]